ncbi:MAG: DNA-binding protein [Pseudoxanthomonas spadix]|nr:MAG: DNA-binding protein [Pseudoxanthomonas spadix]
MVTATKTQQAQDKFVVRFPDGMRDKIAAAAEASGRSMNAEIVQRIENSFEAVQALGDTVALARDALAQADSWRVLVDHLQQALRERDAQAAENLQTIQELKQQVATIGAVVDRIASKV